MKSSVALVLAAAGLGITAFTRSLKALEAHSDIETDHLDASDDAGPRGVGALLDPLGVAFGRVGAEVDVMLNDNVGLSFEANWLSQYAAAYGGRVGVPMFPLGTPFRALYVHPRVAWMRARAPGQWINVVGAEVTVGYEWTWLAGPTLRLGGGVAYSTAAATVASGIAPTGLRPQLDASVGWVF